LFDDYNPCLKNQFRVTEFIKLYDEFDCIQFVVGSI